MLTANHSRRYAQLPDISNSMDLYLEDLRHESLVDDVRENELGHRVQAGDAQAADELVRANLRFVIKVAKHYQGNGVDLDDLIQEGNLGLVRAAWKFDPTRGTRFITYAVWWIRQAIRLALAEQSQSVRLPPNRMNQVLRLRREGQRLRDTLGRQPTCEELAEATGLTPAQVDMLLLASAAPTRLDEPVDSERKSPALAGMIPDRQADLEEAIDEIFLSEAVAGCLDRLDARDSLVLRLYFGLDGHEQHTLEEIGQKLELTRERVRQIRNRALERITKGTSGRVLASVA